MAQTIDTRPQVVDFASYAGDTLTFRVNVPTGFADGLEWTGQIKANRDMTTSDAEFTIVPDEGGAEVTLPAATTRELASGGIPMRVSRGRAVDGKAAPMVAIVRYTGEYDIQVAAPAGADPVTTLVQGSITLDLDVTDSGA